MARKQSIAVATVFAIGLTFAPAARANPVSEVCTALGEARISLYSMLHAKDRSAQDALKAKMQAASNKIESLLDSMNVTDTKVAADFKAVWDQFKATRDNEIVPAIYNGNLNDAKKIADGIQFQRLSRMWSIMSCSR